MYHYLFKTESHFLNLLGFPSKSRDAVAVGLKVSLHVKVWIGIDDIVEAT